MKKLTFLKFLSIVIAILGSAGTARAGHIVLRPTVVTSIYGGGGQSEIGLAVRFDLSAIPPDCKVDLAELQTVANSDSTGKESIGLSVAPIAGEWPSIRTITVEDIVAIDSLAIGAWVESGHSKPLSLEITTITQQWYSGVLVNHGVLIRMTSGSSNYMALASPGSGSEITLTVYYSK